MRGRTIRFSQKIGYSIIGTLAPAAVYSFSTMKHGTVMKIVGCEGVQDSIFASLVVSGYRSWF